MTGRLSAIQIDPERALDEYLHEHLPLRMLADLVGATRLIGYLAAATPGLRELLSVGKLWELAQPERRIPDASPYDLVIVDAPASGHSLALLSAPQAFARAAQGGPVARQGPKIDAMLHDRSQTALVAVARAEEAAVSELIELRAKLRSELALELDALIVNALPAAALRGEDADALRSALDGASELEAGARSAIERVLGEDRDAHAARTQVERLARELPDTPLIELPRCAGAEVGFSELEALSDRLAVVL
jgi:anion-transporting  ArsA/GET3 family ATPase